MSFNLKLNGSNYVSDKTKGDFEQALQDGHQAKLQGNGDGLQQSKHGREQHGGNGASAPQLNVMPAPNTQPPSIAQPKDYQAILESLDRGLAQSYEHQKQTLQVHTQYLHNQGDYSKIFSQLMQQQSALFDNGSGPFSTERLEAALAVLDKLSHSIDQFHAHQAQTLHVHNAFLAQQAEYTQSFVRLLQRQCDTMLNGNGYGNGNGRELFQPSGRDAKSCVSTQPPPSHGVEPPAINADWGSPEADQERSSTTPSSSSDQPAPQPKATPAAAPALDVEALTTSLLDIVSDKTGYPAEMLELDMDMEADLGIDSIKRVEILSALQDTYPDLPEIETEALAELRTLSQIITYTNARMGVDALPAAQSQAKASPTATNTQPASQPKVTPAAAPALDADALAASLLEIVSDKTGYPADMLELDMDMEADLGIDSIKRVEILSALQDAYPDLPEVEAEALGELRTLGQIINEMSSTPDCIFARPAQRASAHTEQGNAEKKV